MANKTRGTTRFVDLPKDLTSEILSTLTIRSLLQLRCVSKSWRDIIDSRYFIEFLLNKSKERDANGTFIMLEPSSLSYVDFDSSSDRGYKTKMYTPEFIKKASAIDARLQPMHPKSTPYVQLIGSCNGLVCFYRYPECCFALYNPATRAFNQLPKLELGAARRKYCCDFVYDSVAGDFKVFYFITYYFNGFTEVINEESYVYSLKANSWKIIPNPQMKRFGSHSVFTNNFLHYIGCKDDHNQVMVRLDVSTYTYNIIPLPSDETIGQCHCLALLRGKLHATTYVFKEKTDELKIWSFDYGVGEHWTQLFSYTMRRSIHRFHLPIAYSKDGKKLLLWVEHYANKLLCCDLQSQTSILYGLNVYSQFFVEPWVGSLFSPCSKTNSYDQTNC